MPAGQHLVDRRLGLRHAVAATVQRLAAGVERQSDLAAGDVYVDHHVGVLKPHPRALALGRTVAEPVDNGVLDAVGHESRVGELIAVDRSLDGKCAVDRQQRPPVELLDAVIERVGSACTELVERLEYSQCRAAAQIGTIEHLLVARKGHHTPSGFHVEGAESPKFVGQYLLKPLKGLGDHLKVLHIDRFRVRNL